MSALVTVTDTLGLALLNRCAARSMVESQAHTVTRTFLFGSRLGAERAAPAQDVTVNANTEASNTAATLRASLIDPLLLSCAPSRRVEPSATWGRAIICWPAPSGALPAGPHGGSR
ncbi:Hypothetical protein PFR_JS14_976 [Propionibacterium freudenreichii]|nr:Hypothetical protein PFR_JS14_976 [Propionibacterium freudenreichii]